MVVALDTVPSAAILPSWIVKPFSESISVTPLIAGIAANDCKLGVSTPPVPAEVTWGKPLNLTLLPATLWWSTEYTLTKVLPPQTDLDLIKLIEEYYLFVL